MIAFVESMQASTLAVTFDDLAGDSMTKIGRSLTAIDSAPLLVNLVLTDEDARFGGVFSQNSKSSQLAGVPPEWVVSGALRLAAMTIALTVIAINNARKHIETFRIVLFLLLGRR